MSAASRVVSASSEAISVIDTLTLTSLGTVTTAATFGGIAGTDVQVGDRQSRCCRPDTDTDTDTRHRHRHPTATPIPVGEGFLALSGGDSRLPVGLAIALIAAATTTALGRHMWLRNRP